MLKVELIGNLGADAEVKNSNGSKFVAMRVAHTDKWKDASGNTQEQTVWVDVTMNDTESKVLPYLRQGVKVFVRGNASLRVYSSPKDKCMKAGLSIAAREIELVGGSSDDVPRRLIDPSTAALYEVTKHYWCNRNNDELSDDAMYQLVDEKGRPYVMNKGGFVVPAADPVGTAAGEAERQGDDAPAF